MAMTLDTSSTAGLSSGSSRSGNYTCTGPSPCLVAVLVWNQNAGDDPSAVTFGGVAMTKQIHASNAPFQVAIYTMMSPPVTEQSFSVTYTEAVENSYTLVSFKGANTISVKDVTGSNSTYSGGESTVTLSVASGDTYIIDGIGIYQDQTGISAVAGQTGVLSSNGSGVVARTSYKAVASAGSTTTKYENVQADKLFIHAAIALVPAPAVTVQAHRAFSMF